MTSTPQEPRTPSALPSHSPGWAIIPVGPREVMRTVDFAAIAEQFPGLANVVEDVAELDIPDGSIAQGVGITILPSTMPHFVVQYRTPITSSRKFGDETVPHRAFQHVATTVRTGTVTISPHGPLGLIIARLRPEAAVCLLGNRIYEFADTKIDLDAVFGADRVSALAERLREAHSSDERIAAVLRFLTTNMGEHDPDPLVSRAAAILRSNPLLGVRSLAKELGLGERRLSRRFKAVFGIGPKRFARSARLEHLLTACGSRSNWANVACYCGFADQAHMINDFKAILGSTPNHFFRSPLIE